MTPSLAPLPERAPTLQGALEQLEGLSRRSDQVLVRIRLDHGSTLEGRVVGVSANEVVVGHAGGEDTVGVGAIRAIELGVPWPFRELLVALAAILAGTGALVLYSLLPWVDVRGTNWPAVFGAVATLGGVLWGFLLGRVRFRRWLTRWSPLYVPTADASVRTGPSGPQAGEP